MAQPEPDQQPMTFVNREDRLAWERERIAEADADLAAGRFIEGEAALDWLRQWAAGEPLDEPDLS